ncbi:hypothetical protein, partial [Bifidobacterium reuteri]|uniref:hypothetical protein n=1 Tax=Bifidobacterium reuteri TaxID=983706 RepID=UPI001CC30D3C
SYPTHEKAPAKTPRHNTPPHKLAKTRLKGRRYRYIRRLLQTLIEAKVLRYGKYITIMPPKECDVAIMPDCLDWVVDEQEFNRFMDERADAIARGGR